VGNASRCWNRRALRSLGRSIRLVARARRKIGPPGWGGPENGFEQARFPEQADRQSTFEAFDGFACRLKPAPCSMTTLEKETAATRPSAPKQLQQEGTRGKPRRVEGFKVTCGWRPGTSDVEAAPPESVRPARREVIRHDAGVPKPPRGRYWSSISGTWRLGGLPPRLVVPNACQMKEENRRT